MPEKSTKKIESHDQFILDIVEDKETKDYTRSRNADAWMNLLNREDYITREGVLALSKMATSGRHKLFILTLSAIEQPSVPLGSCEIMIRESWKYEITEDKQVSRSEVLSGCIGGVFVYPENRGRGLATIMIDKLVALMKQPEYLGPNGYTFLYSEVGDFYDRNGFKSFPVPLLNIPLTAPGKPYKISSGLELIKYKGFEDLFKAHRSHFDHAMRKKVLADGLDRFAIVPTADIIDWFHLRTKFFGTKLFGESKVHMDPKNDSLDDIDEKAQAVEPLYFGLKATCKDTGLVKGFIAWQQDYDTDKKTGEFHNHAIVIKVCVDTDHFDEKQVSLELIEGMKEFFEAEHAIPQMSNFYKIVIWESEISESVKEVLLNKYKCKAGLENSSRSAILCHNAEEARMLRSGEFIWEENTKLPWF